MMVIITMTLTNVAVAGTILNGIQLHLPEQPFDTKMGSLNAGPLMITQWNDGTVQVLAVMNKAGVVSSIDEVLDFNPFSLISINGNYWQFTIGEMEAYSNNGNFIDGVYNIDINMEFFAKPLIDEEPVTDVPEPSSLMLLMLALALLVFARQYKVAQISR
jgi:hypothetical protein